MTAKDPFLLGLFREEMETHSAILTDGLLALERGKQIPDAKLIEPLMRAAHSLKGAARVVDLPEISRVAHRMEDIFIAMGDGKLGATSDLIDQLLGALDFMVSLALVPDAEIDEWLEGHVERTESWEASLAAWLAITGGEGESVVQIHQDTEVAASEETRSLGDARTTESEASIKISAENLSQMLAYSADLLLEARRLDVLARENRLDTRRLLAVGASRGSAQDTAASQALRRALVDEGRRMEAHDEELLQLSSRFNFLSERLHNLVLRGRLRPFSEGVQGFPRMIRDLARELGKEVQFTILGAATLIDRDILHQLDAPLNHLLRNAIDHGIESPEKRTLAGKPSIGQITLEARHLNGRLLIVLSDDGDGIDVAALREKILARGLVTPEMSDQLTDQEVYAFLFLPGITTSAEVSQISGRGVGLDVVQTMIHGCGGAIRVTSDAGFGTRFEFQLPVTRSVIRCLRVEVEGHAYALPLSRIDRAERVLTEHVEEAEGVAFLRGDHGLVRIFEARTIIGETSRTMAAADRAIVRIGADGKHYAFEVDQFMGELDLVIRPLDVRLGKVTHFSSVSIDREGRPILIMDVDDLIRTFDRMVNKVVLHEPSTDEAVAGMAPRILVVDDSLTVREVERKLLESAGYVVETAVDGVDGWNQIQSGRFALVVTDVDMPRMNGIDLVTKIKADPRFLALPTIIVSYKDREEDRLLGINAGADYYLTKGSFQDQGLMDAVRSLVGQGVVK